MDMHGDIVLRVTEKNGTVTSRRTQNSQVNMSRYQGLTRWDRKLLSEMGALALEKQ